MLEGGILVAEQSLRQQPKWTYDLQHFNLDRTRLDGRSEKPYESTGYVKVSHQYDYPEYIVHIALVANKQTLLF